MLQVSSTYGKIVKLSWYFVLSLLLNASVIYFGRCRVIFSQSDLHINPKLILMLEQGELQLIRLHWKSERLIELHVSIETSVSRVSSFPGTNFRGFLKLYNGFSGWNLRAKWINSMDPWTGSCLPEVGYSLMKESENKSQRMCVCSS